MHLLWGMTEEFKSKIGDNNHNTAPTTCATGRTQTCTVDTDYFKEYMIFKILLKAAENCDVSSTV